MEDFIDMIKVGKIRVLAYLGLCILVIALLATCANAALFGLLKSKGKTVETTRMSLVIFPFDRDPELAQYLPDNFGNDVGEYVRSILSESPRYSVFLYEQRLTPVQRAKSDQILKDAEIKGPFFADKAKAEKLADLLATDYYLVGSVESYSYDRDKKVAELTLKADLVRGNGKVVQEFLVAGKADAGTQGMDEEEIRAIAAGKAADALRDKILGSEEKPAVGIPVSSKTLAVTSSTDSTPKPAPKDAPKAAPKDAPKSTSRTARRSSPKPAPDAGPVPAPPEPAN